MCIHVFFRMQETERYRSEYNKLRYEYTFLKTQYDHQREEHARVLEEKRIRYEAEVGFFMWRTKLFSVLLKWMVTHWYPSCCQVSRLEKDKEDLVAQYQGSDVLRDRSRVEALLREKAQLHLRLKGLEAEVAELRAQKENSGQQAENVQRIQIRQLAESQAAMKELEVRWKVFVL